MNAPNWFTRRFAIRMPSGELYTGHDQLAYEQACAAYEQAEQLPSPVRDMVSGLGGLFGGMFGSYEQPAVLEPPKPPGPVIFDSRAQAEELLKKLRSQATAVGVLGWAGCVVEQLCTPFTSGDPATDFAEAVVAWVAQQRTGGAR